MKTFKSNRPSSHRPKVNFIQKCKYSLNQQRKPGRTMKALEKVVYNHFKKSYLLNKNFYNVKVINEIICNDVSHVVAVFKDYLIISDQSEFFQKYFNKAESVELLPRIFDYYDSSSVIFPNYVTLPESKYIYKNIQRKQRIIDNQQELEQKIENKHNKAIMFEDQADKIFDSEAFDSIMNQSDTSIMKSMLGMTVTNTFQKDPNQSIEGLNNIIKEIETAEFLRNSNYHKRGPSKQGIPFMKLDSSKTTNFNKTPNNEVTYSIGMSINNTNVSSNHKNHGSNNVDNRSYNNGKPNLYIGNPQNVNNCVKNDNDSKNNQEKKVTNHKSNYSNLIGFKINYNLMGVKGNQNGSKQDLIHSNQSVHNRTHNKNTLSVPKISMLLNNCDNYDHINSVRNPTCHIKTNTFFSINSVGSIKNNSNYNQSKSNISNNTSTKPKQNSNTSKTHRENLKISINPDILNLLKSKDNLKKSTKSGSNVQKKNYTTSTNNNSNSNTAGSYPIKQPPQLEESLSNKVRYFYVNTNTNVNQKPSIGKSKPNKTEYISISHRQVKSALERNFTPSNVKTKKNIGKISEADLNLKYKLIHKKTNNNFIPKNKSGRFLIQTNSDNHNNMTNNRIYSSKGRINIPKAYTQRVMSEKFNKTENGKVSNSYRTNFPSKKDTFDKSAKSNSKIFTSHISSNSEIYSERQLEQKKSIKNGIAKGFQIKGFDEVVHPNRNSKTKMNFEASSQKPKKQGYIKK